MKLIVRFCEIYHADGAAVAHTIPALYYEDGTPVEAQQRIVIDSGGPKECTTVTATFLANVAEHGVHIEPQIQKKPWERI